MSEEADNERSLPPEDPGQGQPASNYDDGRHADHLGEDRDGFIVPTPGPDHQQVEADLRRLRHRRKRYALFLMRNNRRRVETHQRSTRRTILMALATIVAVVLVLFGALAGLAYAYYQSQLPAIEALQQRVLENDSLRIYDRNGILLYEFQNLGVKRSITYEQIPPVIRNATIAIEDKDFWNNSGIDINRIFAAALHDYSSGQIREGASTITQQLIKNYIFNPNPTQAYYADPTFDRKIREAILAVGMTVSGQYSKSQILAMYLNLIPYGPTIYGIDAAAHEYFSYNDDPQSGKVAAQQLTLAQASFLAGIPKDPNANDPLSKNGLANALGRQQLVLNAMVAQHYITQDEADAAWKASHAVDFLHIAPPMENKAPHFLEYVRQQLLDMVDTGQLNLSRSGLSVYTTLDLPLQTKVQQAMESHLFGYVFDKNGNVIGSQRVPDDYGGDVRYDNASNSAAVLIEQSTGDIRVLLGSWATSLTKAPFSGTIVHGNNDASQGLRQAGSSFKPVVYITAFEKGWFPGMTITDAPAAFPDGSNPPYKPLDFNRGKFEGTVTIRTALQHSLNIPAIKTLNFAGVNNVVCGSTYDPATNTNICGVDSTTMSRLGFTDYNGVPGLAAAIGSLGVKLLDMVKAYTVFANYGRRISANSIDHIVDAEGNLLYQYAPPPGVRVFSPDVSYLLTNVLSDNNARASDFGICSPLRLYTSQKYQCEGGNPGVEYPAAAKTGTTDNLADDWTLGYTMDYTGGVWVGNDNEGTDMYHIDGITGAAPIWYNMMIAAENGRTPTPFPVPQGVVRATYSSNNVTSTDWFLAGSVPQTQGTGNGGPTLCINLLNGTNPWDYCNGQKPPGKNPKP